MLSCQKQVFSLPPELHYLNCAYMSPLSKAVEAAGVEAVRRKRVPTAIVPEDFFDGPARVRERFARLVGAPDPRRVAVIPSASYGLATAARNVKVRRGQNVVVSGEQFPSNVYPWRRLARDRGLELRVIAAPDRREGRGAEWNARLLEAVDRDTAVVALPHVHWTDGTRFDLERIGERARSFGAALIVDGTQSVGALPFDVERIRPDALVCAGYKWLMGPYSIGVAYFGPVFDDGVPLEESWTGREGSEDFRGLVNYRDAYRPGAARFDVGESGNFALVPMLVAALDQLLAWGVPAIQDYCRELTRGLLERAASYGFTAEDEAWRASHLFGLRAPDGLDLERIAGALAERNVSVSVRGSSLRVSPHVYNDEADVAALEDALAAVVAGARHPAATTAAARRPRRSADDTSGASPGSHGPRRAGGTPAGGGA